MDEILNVLENEPDLLKIHEGHHPNEGLLKSLKEDESFLKEKK